MKILDRYLLREIIPAFFLSLGFIILVILMNELFYLAEVFLTRKVPLATVLRVLLYLLPSILALAVPLAFMAGVLGGLGRLAGDRETEALKVLGLTPAQLARPVFILGVSLFLTCLFLTLWLTPVANYRWIQTMVNSVLNRVKLDIEPGQFVESLPGRVLYIQQENEPGNWQGVFLYQKGEAGQVEIIGAERAHCQQQPEKLEAWIVLEKGRSYKFQLDDPDSLGLMEFEKSEQALNLKSLKQDFSLEKKSREKNIKELWLDWKRWREKEAPERRLTVLEIHKRLSLPATCLVFVLLGVGLGWRRWPGGRLGGYGLGLLLILAYYFLLVNGEQQALAGILAPWLAMWLPNILIFLAGFYFFFLVKRKNYSQGHRLLAAWRKIKGWLAGLRVFSRESQERQPKAPIPFPSLVDHYVFSRFWCWLVPGFLGLVLIASVFTFLLRLEMLSGRQKTFKGLLAFTWFKLPELSLFSLLLSLVTAVALSLGLFYRRKEILAFISSGLSFQRLVRSLLLFGLVLVPLLFIFQDRVLSRSNFRAEEIWAGLSDRPVRTFSYLNRYWLRSGENGNFYHYQLLVPERRLLYRLLFLETEKNQSGFRRVIFAREALIEDGGLVLRNGWERTFSGQSSTLNRFVETFLDLPGAGGFFLREWKEPATMNRAELRQYSREMEESGLPAGRFRLEAEFRLAFSLSGLVLILLACAIAGWLGPRGFLWPLAASLAGVFLYWQSLAIFRSLGLAGWLGPFLAAWGPQIIFLLLGVYLLLRSRT
ncbi:MAG: LptF/LptG family permease [Candidatus Saccharicenans sp.]|jgi:LPS export ABC transporter permease LptF|nr:LptF/LptG family permease [Candidatus Saccharicenans sp.]